MRIVLLLCLLLLAPLGFANGNGIELKAHHPMRYEVKPGDTLWKIAQKFLKRPWQWRLIWKNNPHIKNPDKIYAGDVLELHNVNGVPALALLRHGTVRLSPRIRSKSTDDAIPPIELNLIRPFLTGSQIFSDDRLEHAPYVLAFVGEHLFDGQGGRIYVKDLHYNGQKSFSIFRPNEELIDPSTHHVIGYLALHIGEARLERKGDPATLLITNITQGVQKGDRLISSDRHKFESYYFLPQAPHVPVLGEIIYLFGGMTQVGGHQVVVINRGISEGLEAGSVLAVYQPGEHMRDPDHWHRFIQLPNERIGEAMVFKTFEHTSFALVMHTSLSIHYHDFVTNP